MDKQYITIDELENLALVEVAETYVSQAEKYIEAMSNQVALMTNREWLSDPVDYPTTRYFDGNGSAHLRIGEAVAVETVEIGEDYGENFEEVTDYITHPYNSSPITKLIRKDNCWDRGIKNIKVTGAFGYATEVPEDIKFAVATFVAGIIRYQTNQEGEIESEKIGNYSVTYKTEEEKDDYKKAMSIVEMRRVILI